MASNFIGGITGVGRAMVTINVGDLNDETPVFNQPRYSFEVSEGSSLGDLVFSFSASDNDLAAVSIYTGLYSYIASYIYIHVQFTACLYL